MKIYISHPRNFDYQNELYKLVKQSFLSNKHTFILPHEKSNMPFNSKEFLKNECELLIAEVSEPTIGMGIEIGWADVYKVPIICVYRKGSKLSNSLKLVSKNFVDYSNDKELIFGIEKIINQM